MSRARAWVSALSLAALVLAGCRASRASDAAGAAGAAVAAEPKANDDATRAAERIALCDADCTSLGPFYWEIGDANGPIASGRTGDGSVTSTTAMPIASASKWLFGAYVVERFKTDLTKIDIDAMTMRRGYTSLRFPRCTLTATVEECFEARHLDGTRNSDHDAAHDGKFFYGGGHFQRYAVDLGLGPMTRTQLDDEYRSKLGADLAITFAGGSPQPAGGMHGTPAAYAAFLRAMLTGKLALGAHLGENAVCTSRCADALFSPAADYAWHYSYGHWVEDDPASSPAGDGAFSSAGAFGFYPWIDAAKKHYGIVARHMLGAHAGVESAKCGIKIRHAFATSTAPVCK
jgi:hypothetical protein